jgi:hypothetical protein
MDLLSHLSIPEKAFQVYLRAGRQCGAASYLPSPIWA